MAQEEASALKTGIHSLEYANQSDPELLVAPQNIDSDDNENDEQKSGLKRLFKQIVKNSRTTNTND